MIFAIGLLGCAKTERRTPPPPASVTAKSPQPQPVATATANADAGALVPAAAASLVEDALYACTDLSFDLPPEPLAGLNKLSDAGAQFVVADDLSGWLTNDAESLLADILSARRKKEAVTGLRPAGKVQVLSKSCREQFPRAIIATCKTPLPSKEPDAGWRVNVALQTAYYQPTDDKVMQRCIASGSDWWEVSRDSREYIRANADKAMRRLQRHVDSN